MQHQQLWLGDVLARAQPCDGAGPAVELPGLRHVIDAYKEISMPSSSMARIRIMTAEERGIDYERKLQ